MSQRIPICEIEFFGGPQDGHVEQVYVSPAPVVVIAQSPPEPSGFSLSSLLRWFMPKTVRLYTYKLISHGGVWRYEHAATEVARLSELEELEGFTDSVSDPQSNR